jgi:hypothetical protein
MHTSASLDSTFHDKRSFLPFSSYLAPTHPPQATHSKNGHTLPSLYFFLLSLSQVKGRRERGVETNKTTAKKLPIYAL